MKYDQAASSRSSVLRIQADLTVALSAIADREGVQVDHLRIECFDRGNIIACSASTSDEYAEGRFFDREGIDALSDEDAGKAMGVSAELIASELGWKS